MTKSKQEIVKFQGHNIVTLQLNGEPHVAMKPIVYAMGLKWADQYRLIKKDPVLNSTIGLTPTVDRSGKKREMICLPLKYLNGWLFKINPTRYKDPALRETIIKYQRECYQALHDYWHGGKAERPDLGRDFRAISKAPEWNPVYTHLRWEAAWHHPWLTTLIHDANLCVSRGMGPHATELVLDPTIERRKMLISIRRSRHDADIKRDIEARVELYGKPRKESLS